VRMRTLSSSRGDIIQVQVVELGKPDIDIRDTACVCAANLLKKQDYVLRSAHSKILAILGVEHQPGSALDSLFARSSFRESAQS
jgi:hypothetical protein